MLCSPRFLLLFVNDIARLFLLVLMNELNMFVGFDFSLWSFLFWEQWVWAQNVSMIDIQQIGSGGLTSNNETDI